MRLFLALIAVLFSGHASATDWETSAHTDMNSSGGKIYEQAAARFSASQLDDIMAACMGDVVPTEFVLYFKIMKDGSIAETHASTATPVAACFSEKLAALTWPAPPSSPFVFKISMFGEI